MAVSEASPTLILLEALALSDLALAVTIISQVTGSSGEHCLWQHFCYGICKLGTPG